ncbi:MAG: hypothetical protein HC822_15200 [Oscillochloris sp.]|nr:hypothetical protein [Oscillochloris sp.]
MARLGLNLLGAPELWLAGRPVTLERQKALALLAYLAIGGQPQSREHLAALLWPDLAAPRAQAALRQALWTIGSTLGSEWIASDRVRVELVAADLDLDVHAFRSMVQRARREALDSDILAAAVARYRGDLLAGLTLRDAEAFDEWRFFESEGLRADLIWALDALGEAYSARNQYAQALDFARRRLALDQLHEPAHRRLIRLYAAAGQRQYDECVRVLQAELGAEPEAETTRLYQAVRAERASQNAGAGRVSAWRRGPAGSGGGIGAGAG